MIRRLLWHSALAGALGLAACSRSIVERLENPTAVVSVEADGVRLSDGRFFSWGLGMPVPPHLAALGALTAHGVDVAPDGRMSGLVEVWHWCGNDPIRKHLARVDIGLVLEFLGGRNAPGEGQPLDFGEGDGQFEARGWRVDNWYAFERWRGADPGRIYE